MAGFAVSQPRTARRASHAGAVLLLTLMFLVLLGLLAATVMQSAAMQFRQAGNNLHLERALQQAKAVALETAQRRESFDLGTGIGHTRCLPDSLLAGCDARDLAEPVAIALDVGVKLEVTVTRNAPLEVVLPGSSPPARAGLFEVAVQVQGGDVGLGSARVAYGVAAPVDAGAAWPVYWREPGIDAL